ncbi:MAG: alpha/beta hydrolase [Sphingomonas bacterium]|nr:alpha/beta hydrolase [Sphingomonas bacterium]
MAVDPQFAPILAFLTSMPLMRDVPLEAVRTSSLPPGKITPIAQVEDREASTPEGPLALRIYAPRHGSGLSIIVFFHGGGFVVGGFGSHDEVARQLANAADSIVVSVQYRLAPENPFPAASDDCLSAVRWAAAHAIEFGGDAGRIAVAGDSAGGNLAAVTAIRLRDEGGPKLRAQLLLYPATDLDAPHEGSMAETAEGFYLRQEDLHFFHESYAGTADRRNPHISPLHADDLGRLPPAMVITAECDPLRDQGEAYAKQLALAGTSTEYVHYSGAIHGFMTFPCEMGERAIEAAGHWLKCRLAG